MVLPLSNADFWFSFIMILASFAFVHKHLNIIFICKVLYALDHWFARKRERKERKREKKRKKREKREKKRELEGKTDNRRKKKMSRVN